MQCRLKYHVDLYAKFLEHMLLHRTHIGKGKKNRTVLSLFLTNTSDRLTSDGKTGLGKVESQKGHQKWLPEASENK